MIIFCLFCCMYCLEVGMTAITKPRVSPHERTAGAILTRACLSGHLIPPKKLQSTQNYLRHIYYRFLELRPCRTAAKFIHLCKRSILVNSINWEDICSAYYSVSILAKDPCVPSEDKRHTTSFHETYLVSSVCLRMRNPYVVGHGDHKTPRTLQGPCDSSSK
jgi:hypothetical protein